jgi:deazaflavin-dependent oxidoreductase (nitroreductase family)
VNVLRPLAIRIGASRTMPKLLPVIVWLDTRYQRLTRGRFGLPDLGGLPNLMLTVPGRRTGLPRHTPLLCVPHEGRFLIAGSNWGQPAEPLWVKNLEAAGAGELRFKGRTHRFTARRLTGDERATAWRVMNRTWPNYANYERRTDRPIKVFELTPAD